MGLWKWWEFLGKPVKNPSGIKQNSEPIWHPRTMLWFTSVLKDDTQCISMYTTKSSSWVQINFIHFNMEVKTCQVNPVLENAKTCWFLTFSDLPKDLESCLPTNLWLQHVETNKPGSMKHHKTALKFNKKRAPQKGPGPKRKVLFQASILKGYVEFWRCSDSSS